MTTRLTKERIEEIRNTHGCLIPRQGAEVPSCHEKTSCDCTVVELLQEIDALRTERDDAHKLLREAASLTIPGEVDTGDALVQMLRERDSLKAELEILKNPSDGRCMEIGALRERNQTLLTAAIQAAEALEIAYEKLKSLPWKGGAAGPTWITEPRRALEALRAAGVRGEGET
jgi:hypothetical protein